MSGIGSFTTSGALARDKRLARIMFTIIALQSLQMFIRGPCSDFSLIGATKEVSDLCNGGRDFSLFLLLLMRSGGDLLYGPFLGCSGELGTEPVLQY